jgi:hypothetical protein
MRFSTVRAGSHAKCTFLRLTDVNVCYLRPGAGIYEFNVIDFSIITISYLFILFFGGERLYRCKAMQSHYSCGCHPKFIYAVSIAVTRRFFEQVDSKAS